MPGNCSLMHVPRVICLVCYSKASFIHYSPAVREMEVEVSQRSSRVLPRSGREKETGGGSLVLDESPVHSFPLRLTM